jgi:uncharacterized membrane protein
LIAVVAVLLWLPAGLRPLPNGDDLAQHYWWTTEFTRGLADGQLYPRWLSGAYDGRGSPAMFYYPPVPFYASSVFNVLFDNPLRGLALGSLLAMVFSGLAMYLFCRSLCLPLPALVGALLYLLLPYHLFDLYQRSALNEFWALAWVPLVFHGSLLVSRGDARFVPYLALSYCLLIMTHLPTTLLVSVALPIFVLSLTRDWRRLLLTGGAIALGVVLSSIYLSSVLFETGYLRTLPSVGRSRYYDSYLFENLPQAVTSLPLPSNGNFLAFVRASDLMAACTLLLIAATLFGLVRRLSEFTSRTVVASAALTAVFSLFMTTRLSAPLWQVIPRVRVVQFPVRWFTVTSAAVAVLAALCWAKLAGRKDSTVRVILYLAIGLNLVLSALVIVRAPYQAERLRQRLENYTDVMEYHPRWWDQQRHPEFDTAPVVVQNGNAVITPIDEFGTSQSYQVSAQVRSVLVMRTLYFPGWVARVGGQVANVNPSPAGHIQLIVQPGEQNLSLTLEDTPARRWGRIASAAGLACWLVAVLLAVRVQRNRSFPPGSAQDAAEAAEVNSTAKADRAKTASSRAERGRR